MLSKTYREQGYRPVPPFKGVILRPSCPRLHGRTARVFAAQHDENGRPVYYLAGTDQGELVLATEEVSREDWL